MKGWSLKQCSSNALHLCILSSRSEIKKKKKTSIVRWNQSSTPAVDIAVCFLFKGTTEEASKSQSKASQLNTKPWQNEQSDIFAFSKTLWMSLHRERYVTQSDLHKTVSFLHHTWRRPSRATRSCLTPRSKVWDRREKKNTPPSVSDCQKASKKNSNSYIDTKTNTLLLLVSR